MALLSVLSCFCEKPVIFIVAPLCVMCFCSRVTAFKFFLPLCVFSRLTCSVLLFVFFLLGVRWANWICGLMFYFYHIWEI